MRVRPRAFPAVAAWRLAERESFAKSRKKLKFRAHRSWREHARAVPPNSRRSRSRDVASRSYNGSLVARRGLHPHPAVVDIAVARGNKSRDMRGRADFTTAGESPATLRECISAKKPTLPPGRIRINPRAQARNFPAT